MIDPESLSDVLSSMGVVIHDVRGDEVVGLCPGHRERTGRADHSPSWSVNADKQTHHCFSCGYSGTLVGLVADLLGVRTKFGTPDYDKAAAILEEKIGGTLPDLATRLERQREGTYYLPKPVPMSEARLAVYTTPPKWALNARGIDEESAHAFGVHWDDKGSNWILPARDPETGSLMGWQEKGEGTRYFKNRPTGLKKSRTLFGITNWEGPDMLVVESPLDAVRAHAAGIPATACFGAIFSDAQVVLMQRAERIIVAFDNPARDDAGRKALESMYCLSREMGFDFWAFNYGGAPVKDIGEFSAEEIRFGTETAVHCLRGLKALVA